MFDYLQDVVKGQETLNLAFVANLFNNFPGLDPPAAEVDIIEETREEKVNIILRSKSAFKELLITNGKGFRRN